MELSSRWNSAVRTAGIISLFLLISACAPLTQPEDPMQYLPVMTIPTLRHPPDNEPTPERLALGKLLFNSTLLSEGNDVSCASCHLENFAFADTTPVSRGTLGRVGTSNSPSIVYAAFEPGLLRAATVPTLEMHVLVPLQEENEFHMNILDVVDRFNANPDVQAMSLAAYDRPFDPWVLTRAISVFVRSLPAFSSKFDAAYQQKNFSEFSMAERRGIKLFYGSAGCVQCHSDALFTNHLVFSGPPSAAHRNRIQARTDIKVPSLRNVAVSPPYFHDGTAATLHAVLQQYKNGERYYVPTPKPLSDADIRDIEAFLTTLTDL
ncbi:MAG: c-type cytochrome [Chlorobi bacterium]|nr:c-type cytochrome [Candidatus Kapabacteria bacterium]NOG66914.1 c-type cytochrome [Chlorobiota bacterium]